MSSEIERLWELDSDDHFSTNYRTSCQCTCEDHSMDFGVNVDVHKVGEVEQGGQVWLDVGFQCHQYSDVWDTPRWSRPFRSFWSRLMTCKKLLFRGYVEVEASFIFRGDDQIDEFVETIIEAKDIANKKKEIADNE